MVSFSHEIALFVRFTGVFVDFIHQAARSKTHITRTDVNLAIPSQKLNLNVTLLNLKGPELTMILQAPSKKRKGRKGRLANHTKSSLGPQTIMVRNGLLIYQLNPYGKEIY